MSRYGIAEWYGSPFLELTPRERQHLAAIALDNHQPPPCPFRRMTCNKKGGVCSIQPYEKDGAHIGEPAGNQVITCPVRFDQDGVVVSWLAEIVKFSAASAMVAREIPFMHSTTTDKPAGKIDLVVAEQQHRLIWFGLEIQAVYFSGPGMESEFESLRHSTSSRAPFPKRVRRPDWRSSSAKRLMPQLQVKGPTLRRWHSKIAVAVDKPFFDSIGGPSQNPRQDLDSGDVIWLVPELSAQNQIERGHWEILTLEESTAKLLSAEPIARSEFEQLLRDKLKPLADSQ